MARRVRMFAVTLAALISAAGCGGGASSEPIAPESAASASLGSNLAAGLMISQ
ncbi:hypothetical protein [Saccharopolyspora pogona]|uniref:hypothetical protein n=1 Tax=Saccharopolyspora pogona TaxID=333966 RepID=UPI0016877140|nr:hypothetical protein [Saccharopolyspora pogona]